MMTHKKKIEDKKIKGRGNIESLTLRTCMYCNVVLVPEKAQMLFI